MPIHENEWLKGTRRLMGNIWKGTTTSVWRQQFPLLLGASVKKQPFEKEMVRCRAPKGDSCPVRVPANLSVSWPYLYICNLSVKTQQAPCAYSPGKGNSSHALPRISQHLARKECTSQQGEELERLGPKDLLLGQVSPDLFGTRATLYILQIFTAPKISFINE